MDAQPVLVEDTLVVAAGGRIYALDTATGATRWQLTPDPVPIERGRPDTAVAVTDETILALVGINFGTGGGDYHLYAISPDGSVRWETATGVGGFHYLIGVRDGVAVFGTGDDALSSEPRHSVFAVEAATGATRWSGTSGDAAGGAVGSDLAVIQTYNAVDTFELGDGTQQYRYTTDDTDVAGTAAGNGRAFVGLERFDAPADATTLVGLEADGSVAWEGAVGFVSSLRYRGDLFVGGESVTRWKPDGTRRWTYDRGGLLSGVPFDADALYTNADSEVVSVGLADGTERWVTAASELAIPATRGGDRVVSLDGSERTAFAHDAATGQELWRGVLPGEYPPDPVADASGTYLVTDDGSVAKV